MGYSHTGNNNQIEVVPQTMPLGFQRQISHSNFNNQRQIRYPPTHRQGQYNTANDRQIYPGQDKQQPHSHLQPTSRTEQVHQYPTNTRDQPYRTQNLAYNTIQHYQVLTQNQFQNPIIS